MGRQVTIQPQLDGSATHTLSFNNNTHFFKANLNKLSNNIQSYFPKYFLRLLHNS
ncbi:hypothetical protein [uncultured Gammaproteobacteria bacterium]|nr:hypothetical protein [uncultured Gammaproteobacteria bacterium]CAC9982217.1 hypothetical protein [uncultured Gammaproteobacteria bacterium]